LAAAEVVAAVDRAAALHAQLAADGFVLTGRCKGNVRKNWDVSLRLVWRKRATEETVTLVLVCPSERVDGRLIIGLGYVLEIDEQWACHRTISAGVRS
jgi:hypothetical protein